MYVYQIIHIPTGKFYIGRTKKPSTRFYTHFTRSTNPGLRLLCETSAREDFLFEVLYSGLSLADSIQIEQSLLLDFADNSNLLNEQIKSSSRGEYWQEQITKGAATWRKENPEISYQISVNSLNTEKALEWVRNNKEEHRKRTKEALRKYWDNKPQQERVCHNRDVQVAKLNPILMCTTTGLYVGTFDSIRQIVRCFPDLHRAAIGRVLKNKAKQHKNYVFHYSQRSH